MRLQFLPEVPLKQKGIALLLLQLMVVDDNNNDSIFSADPEIRNRLIDRVDFLNTALLKCLSKKQSFYLMWRAFNPGSKSKIVMFSDQDESIDWTAYKIQACEAMEATSHSRSAEVNTATQARQLEFEHRKQEVRAYYASLLAVELGKIDVATADMKSAAKRQRKKYATKLLVVTAASAGVASCVGAALQSSMLAANAAANATANAAAVAGAATVGATSTAATATVGASAAAAPTLTLGQSMALGSLKGLTMSTVQVYKRPSMVVTLYRTLRFRWLLTPWPIRYYLWKRPILRV